VVGRTVRGNWWSSGPWWSSGVETVTRVAAFDCGTNSLRLLVADLDLAAGTSRDVVREMRIVRLGQGVDRTGRIAEASLQRVFAAVEEYMEEVRGLDVDHLRFCATSAARDAENAGDFLAGIRDRVGVQPEVLVGDDEARTSFAGAVRDLPPLPEPLMVLDIGGGSTELILGTGDGAVEAARSLDIGSVRLNERHLHTDPPTKAEIREAVADIDATLDTSEVDLARAASVIGVAGTVTTVAAGVLGLATYDPGLIHRSVLRTDAVQGQVAQLLAMVVEQRKALGYMHPGRADVIGAGGLILDRILRRTTVGSLLVSEHDILDGIAWSMVDERDSS
jgi:exopolyphosphatase/guanosine-5'-triphosphate,3'-diphosphate pyrophosphatase